MYALTNFAANYLTLAKILNLPLNMEEICCLG